MPETTKTSESNECPGCASANVVERPETAEVICKDCGLIFAQFVPEAELLSAEKKKKVLKKPLVKKKKPARAKHRKAVKPKRAGKRR